MKIDRLFTFIKNAMKAKYKIHNRIKKLMLCYFSSRAGKGLNLVILDSKSECFEKTSAYLASIGHKCVKLHLVTHYDGFNPLSSEFIGDKSYEI